ACTALGDRPLLVTELERAAGVAQGERRTRILLRLAREHEAAGDAARALGLHVELLRGGELPADALEATERLAGAASDLAILPDAALDEDPAAHPRRRRDLVAAKARVLSRSPERAAAARTLLRSLVEDHGDPADIETLAAFLAEQSADPSTYEDARWLFALRV